MNYDNDVLNHSTAHLLAEAVLKLYPDAKNGFGPSIEEGFYYDFDFVNPISESDLVAIEKEMKKIAKNGAKFIKEIVSKEKALELFKDNKYKLELIEGIQGEISIYRQGEFYDLCSGPHVEKTSELKNFKLLSLAGAYWRGDSNNKQLTRIYGTSFNSKEELENHLKILEDRKQRDHRKLGKELDLFMISEYGPGFPFWLPNGMTLRNELENFWYKIHEDNGYVFVKTPIMLDSELWRVSGHYSFYKENMYFSEDEGKEFAIKPMNCPGGLLVYKNSLHSYKDLPVRMGELGLVHRKEASGALNGLFRVRTFTQDDAHIYCTLEQLQTEIVNMLDLYDKMYALFGLDYHIELSTRPEKEYIGDIKIWELSEKLLAEACLKSGRKFIINKGDGAFYGPKLDFKLKDSMNRIWQCGTIQLDMNLPDRFGIYYIDEKGEKATPVMLHRAIYGSIERFIGILIEHFGGNFPLWMAPEQVRILPVNNSLHNDYSNQLAKMLKEEGIRACVDNSEEKLGYRMRNAQIKKIPYGIVVGDNELNNNTITYRRHGSKDQHCVSTKEFIELLKVEISSKALPIK